MKTPALKPSVLVLSEDGRFGTPELLNYLVDPSGGIGVNTETGKLEIDNIGDYVRVTFETISKNLASVSGVAVKNVDTGLLETITYANGIVKTFTWDLDRKLQSIVLSGNTPSGIVLTKTVTWTSTGFTFDYNQ